MVRSILIFTPFINRHSISVMRTKQQLMSDLYSLRVDYAIATKQGKLKEAAVAKVCYANTSALFRLAYHKGEEIPPITEPPSESDCEGCSTHDDEETTKGETQSPRKREHDADTEHELKTAKLEMKMLKLKLETAKQCEENGKKSNRK